MSAAQRKDISTGLHKVNGIGGNREVGQWGNTTEGRGYRIVDNQAQAPRSPVDLKDGNVAAGLDAGQSQCAAMACTAGCRAPR